MSTTGGSEARWSGDGNGIFRRQNRTAMVAKVSNKNSGTARSRALIFVLEPGSWDVSSKGDFFVTLHLCGPPQLHLVVNWLEELRRLVGAKN